MSYINRTDSIVNIHTALNILNALADGQNPQDGTELNSSSVFLRTDVARALTTVCATINALADMNKPPINTKITNAAHRDNLWDSDLSDLIDTIE